MKRNLAASGAARKCETPPKFTLPSTPAAHVPAHVVSGPSPYFDGFFKSICQQAGFFADVTKEAGFINKELHYTLRVSPSLVDMWKSGERIDPLTRAREVVEMFRAKGRSNLIPSILIFIAGGYDGAVLSAEQFEALKVLTKVVKSLEDQP